MKINLKQGEHLRIAHDGEGTFRVYIEDGLLHVTALPVDDKLPLIVTERAIRVEH